MLMNVLASALLFLFIGPFRHVSSGETKEAGVSSSQVKEVYIAVNDTLELNCSINATVHNIHPTQLGWKHNSAKLINLTRIVNNTIQLRKHHTQYNDAGVYQCGLFDSSKFQSVQKIVVIVGEKPKVISRQQFNVEIYGKPVQEVIVKWPTLQANVTNELFVGRVHVGQYRCKFNNITQCRRTPELQHEPLSCHIGMDVLGKLFNTSELLRLGCRPNFRCDIFCVKVLVKNSFGASESDPARWNLLHDTLCPPLGNLTVSFDGHHLTASWQRPPVHLDVPIKYFVTYDITPLLTGKTSRAEHFANSDIDPNCTECAWSIYPIIPFARYNFTAACNFDFRNGPAVHTQVITKEAAPSKAPYWCEMKNRSRHEAFVSWKVPSVRYWNGKPNKFLVHYGDRREIVNTSLAELLARYNRSASLGVPLKNLDPGRNYTARVAMCTGGGCGNWSEPCFIRDNTEDDSNVKVVTRPDDTNRTAMTTVLAIAVGTALGVILVALILWLMWRKRSQRKKRPPLSSVLNPLTGFHPYDNPIDESPSLSEDDQFYDIIEPIIQRPLLANADGPVVNLPVTDI